LVKHFPQSPTMRLLCAYRNLTECFRRSILCGSRLQPRHQFAQQEGALAPGFVKPAKIEHLTTARR
jgi:hypothetical protein